MTTGYPAATAARAPPPELLPPVLAPRPRPQTSQPPLMLATVRTRPLGSPQAIPLATRLRFPAWLPDLTWRSGHRTMAASSRGVTVTAGSAGSNTCASSTTGTFATSNIIATLATNLAAAINACPAAAGVTAIAAGPVVSLTARIAGSTGNSSRLELRHRASPGQALP